MSWNSQVLQQSSHPSLRRVHHPSHSGPLFVSSIDQPIEVLDSFANLKRLGCIIRIYQMCYRLENGAGPSTAPVIIFLYHSLLWQVDRFSGRSGRQKCCVQDVSATIILYAGLAGHYASMSRRNPHESKRILHWFLLLSWRRCPWWSSNWNNMDDAEAADLKLLKRLTLGSFWSGKSALNVCKFESVESENVRNTEGNACHVSMIRG